MTALVITVTALACLAALLTLAAALVRQHYTSSAGWRRLAPPGALTQMHAEQSVRDAASAGRPHAVAPLNAAAGDWYCRTCELAFTAEAWRGDRCPNE